MSKDNLLLLDAINTSSVTAKKENYHFRPVEKIFRIGDIVEMKWKQNISDYNVNTYRGKNEKKNLLF